MGSRQHRPLLICRQMMTSGVDRLQGRDKVGGSMLVVVNHPNRGEGGTLDGGRGHWSGD